MIPGFEDLSPHPAIILIALPHQSEGRTVCRSPTPCLARLTKRLPESSPYAHAFICSRALEPVHSSWTRWRSVTTKYNRVPLYRHQAKRMVASSLIWSHGEVAAQKNNNPADTMVSGTKAEQTPGIANPTWIILQSQVPHS